MTAFWRHIARHELENVTERFASAPPGTFRQVYTRAGARKSLSETGWCRIWVCWDGPEIIAHASLYDLGEPDGVCFGHIGIEKPYRGKRLAAGLQRARLAFCDRYNLTLCGGIALGNDHSFHGCRRNGFEFLRFDPATQETWVYRSPRTADHVH